MASLNRAFQCHYISVLYHLQDTTIYVEDIKGYVTLTVPITGYYLSSTGWYMQWVNRLQQDSHKPGKPGIVREYCKPGKVREFEMWSGNFL